MLVSEQENAFSIIDPLWGEFNDKLVMQGFIVNLTQTAM